MKKTTAKKAGKNAAKKNTPTKAIVNLAPSDRNAPSPFDYDDEEGKVVPDTRGPFYIKEKKGGKISYTEVKPVFTLVVSESDVSVGVLTDVEWTVPGKPGVRQIFREDADKMVPYDECETELRGRYRSGGRDYFFSFVPDEGGNPVAVFGPVDGEGGHKAYALIPGRYPLVDTCIDVGTEDDPGMLPVNNAGEDFNWTHYVRPGEKKPVCNTCTVPASVVKILSDAISSVRKMGYDVLYHYDSESIRLVAKGVGNGWRNNCTHQNVPNIPDPTAYVDDIGVYNDEDVFFVKDTDE